MKNLIQQQIKKTLLTAEKYIPTLSSRAWGLWQDPAAELLGLRITQLNETQCEVRFKNHEGHARQFVTAAELALQVLWKRHLRNDSDHIVLTQCNFELLPRDLKDKFSYHFIARTELLENDRERVLREGQAEYESVVLIFDEDSMLTARVHSKVKIKTDLADTHLALREGEKK